MAYQPVAAQPEKPLHPQYGSTAGTTKVITEQPGYTTTLYINNQEIVNRALIFSIVVAIICGIMSPITLFCSITGIICAALARSETSDDTRRSQIRFSFVFSGIALGCGIAFTIAAIAYYASMA